MSQEAPFHCRFITMNYIDAGPSWRAVPHTHPFWELVYIREGKQSVAFPDHAGLELTGGANEIFLYPPNCYHFEYNPASVPLHTVYIGFTTDALPAEAPCLVSDSTLRIHTLLRWLEEAAGSFFPRQTDLCYAITTMIVAAVKHFRDCAGEETAAPPFIERIRRYIRENPHLPHSTSSLARFVNLSRYHFIHLYKLHAGISPMRDVRRIRLELAARKLLTEKVSIREVAIQVGLPELSHFSRSFKKQFGISPSRFRRNAEGRSLRR
ncbi:MAG: AraC family transcriptional regulator [Lentisphaerae bacterium]|nr:MAG: AraC family transcriptional regulator [Lentisphaerota bacterium]